MKEKTAKILIPVVLLLCCMIAFDIHAESARDASEAMLEEAADWFKKDSNALFFADSIYGSMALVLNYIFINLFTAFTSGYKEVIRGVFHLALLIYFLLGLKGHLKQTAISTLKTCAMLLITFNITIDLDVYREYIYDYFFMFPKQVQQFFFGIRLPGFKMPEELNMDNLYYIMCKEIWGEAKSAASYLDMLGSAIRYIINGFVVVMIYVYYIAYWIIQLVFLFMMFMYMVVGIPLLVTVSFKGTSHVFYEWLRGMFTVVLYPVFATLIVYIVNNFLFWSAQDLTKMVETESDMAGPVVVTLTVIIFGIFFLRQVPNFAATLTRGTAVSGPSPTGPVDTFKEMVRDVYKKGSGIDHRPKDTSGYLGTGPVADAMRWMGSQGKEAAQRGARQAGKGYSSIMNREGTSYLNMTKAAGMNDHSKEINPTQVKPSSNGNQQKHTDHSNQSHSSQTSENRLTPADNFQTVNGQVKTDKKEGISNKSTQQTVSNQSYKEESSSRSEQDVRVEGKGELRSQSLNQSTMNKPNYHRDAANSASNSSEHQTYQSNRSQEGNKHHQTIQNQKQESSSLKSVTQDNKRQAIRQDIENISKQTTDVRKVPSDVRGNEKTDLEQDKGEAFEADTKTV